MNKFIFNIGATVHCKNGKYGKLQKLVVDPESMEITDLIVGKGLIRTDERIVPVSAVDCATDEYVMLSIKKSNVEDYPEYVEVLSNSSEEVDTKSKRRSIKTAYVAHPYVFGLASPYSPVFHQTVRANVHPDHEVIERGTSVCNQSKKIGSVDHLLVDEESGELTHLVVDPGLLAGSIIVPISTIERINEEGIFLTIEEEEIDDFPEYSKRDDAGIVSDL
jgi:sporulation protein YlmC with PRC-barrel domain